MPSFSLHGGREALGFFIPPGGSGFVKEIPMVGQLGKGLVALVDDEDYETLSKYRWRVQCANSKTHYAVAGHTRDGTFRRMHRMLMSPIPDRLEVDHINRNGLDNRRENLRYATRTQQVMNRGPMRRRSGVTPYKGVEKCANLRADRQWRARIYVGGKRVELGNYRTDEDAARAYNAAAVEHFGEFAHLNEVQQLVHV